MNGRTIKVGAVVAAAGALAAGGIAAAADSGEGSEGPAPTGATAEQAKAAGLAAAGGVKVNAVELDSEKGATWEVEVAMADGSTVDVRLDANLKLVVIDPDSEAGDPADGAGDEQGGDADG